MQIKTNLNLLLVIGTFLVLLLVLFIMLIIVVYQRRMIQHKVEVQHLEIERQHSVLKALLEGEEIERKRLAEELHDGVGQVLMAIKMNLSHLNKAHQNNINFDDVFIQTKQLADDSILEIRHVINNIMPPMLNETGLVNTLKNLCKKINQVSDIKVVFACEQNDLNCNSQNALSLYRITQELFNNSIKYSQATEINVQLQKNNNSLELTFADNGIGFDKSNIVEKPLSGFGLKNIENRIYLLNGKFEIQSTPQIGTSIKITIES